VCSRNYQSGGSKEKPPNSSVHTFHSQQKYLVGGFSPTHLKNMLVKLDHLPNFRGENKKY